MRNYITILILFFVFSITSCQVLDERTVTLSDSFCKACKDPLKEFMLKNEGVYVVKYKEDNTLFYNYDKAIVNIDSLENVLTIKGFLLGSDSITFNPSCCEAKKEEAVIDSTSLDSI